MRSSRNFFNAMTRALDLADDLEYLRLTSLVEKLSNTEAGSQLMAATTSSQAPSHTPPSSSYDPKKHRTLHEVIVPDPKADALDDEQFYFAFGQQLNTIMLCQKASDALAAGILKPEADELCKKLICSAQSLVAIELIEAILVTKVHPPQEL
jgi:hypothetical protein